MVAKYQCQISGCNSSPVFKATRKDVLLELMKVSKVLQETITTSTIRKRNVDEFIKLLIKEKEVKDEEKVNNYEEDEE